MGTRCGDLDPAVVPFLMERLSTDAAGVEAVMNRKSGLLGLAGVADLRAVTAAADAGDDRAQLALKARPGRYSAPYHNPNPKPTLPSQKTAPGAIDARYLTSNPGLSMW